MLAIASAAGAQMSASAPLPGDMVPAPLVGSQWEPGIAASNSGFLAVWSDERASLETTVELDPWEVVQSDIFAQRLGPDGTPIDIAPIRVDASAYSQVSSSVGSNGTDWLVAYESRSVSSTGYYTTQDLRAVRVSSAGLVLDTTPLVIDTTDGEAYVPTVASDGTDWAVFWTDAGSIKAREVTPAGIVGPTRTVIEGAGWVFDPRATFAGDRYLVVWEGSGVVGRFYSADLDPLGPPFTISVLGADPRIATDGTDFFVTIKVSSSWPEVRGTVVRADGTVVNPNGIVLDDQSYISSGFPAVTWDGSGSPCGLERVALRLADRTSIGTQDQSHRCRRRVGLSAVQVDAYWERCQLARSRRRFPRKWSFRGVDGHAQWHEGRLRRIRHDRRCGGKLPARAQLHGLATRSVGSGTRRWADGPDARGRRQPGRVRECDSSETRIGFQRLDGEGTALDPEPILVAGGSDNYTNPAAVWNGTEWLVIWEDSRGGTGTGGVLAARVLADGTILDTIPIQVMDGNDPDVAALAIAGGDFLVAASSLFSGDTRSMYGRRVGADGSLLDASRFFLGYDYAESVSVGGFDDRWIVAWHKRPTHDTPSSSLQARFVLADGSVQPSLDPTTSTDDELFPDIAIEGGVATIAWADGTDIRVRQMQKDGTLLGSPAGVVVSSAANEQTTPTIVADGSKFTVTWVDDRIHGTFEPGVGDLFGARLDSSLMVLEPEGLALAADPNAAEGESGLAGRIGVTTALYPAILPQFGTWRASTGMLRDWNRMGSDLPGSGGPPRLWMSGLLTSGSKIRFAVSDASPFTRGLHFIGVRDGSTPFLGGTLVPTADVLLGFKTNALGKKTNVYTLNSSLPPGTQIYIQSWIFDPSGPQGATATKALHSTSP